MATQDSELDLNEEEIYAEALSELKSGTARPGIWAKAFADSEGDEKRSQALYIKLRVQYERMLKEQKQAAANASAAESARQKAKEFSDVIEQLRLKGYEAKKSGAGWIIREPLGGREALDSDNSLLEYAQSRIAVKSRLTENTKRNVDQVGALRAPMHPTDRIEPSANLLSPEILATATVPQSRPWVRFWARLFDIYIFTLVFGVVSIYIFALPVSDKGQELLLGMTALFFWIFVESACLSSFGVTPGKWLLKVKITSANDQGISYSRALSRSFKVWWRGLGIGFPFAGLVTMSIAASRLRKNGITSWDKEGEFTVTHGRIGVFRASFMVILMLSFFFAIAISESMSRKSQRSNDVRGTQMGGDFDAREAARYGLSVQEYRRRNARIEAVCRSGNIVDLDCSENVIAGRR